MRRNVVTNHRYLIALTVTVTTGCPIGWDTIGGMDDEVGGTDTSGDGDGDGDTSTTDDTTDDTTTDDTSTTDDTTTDDTTTDDTTDDTTTGDGDVPPEQPQNLELSYEQVKQFQFTWAAAAQAETYQLLERENPNADYMAVGLPTASTETSLTVPLHMRVNANK